MSKVLMLSFWNVNRTASGGIRRINALLQTLGEKVILCQPTPAHPAGETLTYRVDFGRRKRMINWGMFNFIWPGNARLVRRAIAQYNPSAIVMTSIWNYFALSRAPGIPVVLDAHDVNAVAVGERLGHRHLFTRLVKAWEKHVIKKLDHLFVCSEQDRQQFISLYGMAPDRVTVVPNGVDLSLHQQNSGEVRLPEKVEEAIKNATVLFFMGKLDYQPNREALSFLCRVLMPELESRQPGTYKLLVSGGPIPPDLFHPAVCFAGILPTEQLAAALHRADICLAPILSGSGTRLKILEYMASGKAVVSTAKGAEGIPAFNDRDFFITPLESFADVICRLRLNPEERKRAGDSARTFISGCYDWKTSIAPRWCAVLNRWLN